MRFIVTLWSTTCIYIVIHYYFCILLNLETKLNIMWVWLHRNINLVWHWQQTRFTKQDPNSSQCKLVLSYCSTKKNLLLQLASANYMFKHTYRHNNSIRALYNPMYICKWLVTSIPTVKQWIMNALKCRTLATKMLLWTHTPQHKQKFSP